MNCFFISSEPHENKDLNQDQLEAQVDQNRLPGLLSTDHALIAI